MATSAAAVFDLYCSDGTVRDRFLAIWGLGSATLHKVARLGGFGIEIRMAEHVLASIPCLPSQPDSERYEIATLCTPPLIVLIAFAADAAPATRKVSVETLTAVTKMVGRLFEAEIGAHLMASNMAHEIAILLLGTGIAMQALDEGLTAFSEQVVNTSLLPSLRQAQQFALGDSRLGLFLVRNFLSASSGSAYGATARGRHRLFSLEDLLEEMLDLYKRIAARRGIAVRRDAEADLPAIKGDPDEIKRAIHNVLNNAVKYSYGSGAKTDRFIRVRTKVPYDPGFRQRRLGIEFSNFGLGLSEAELKRVFQYGFRGQQATEEVAVGSGIGLSEVKKIMTSHNGSVKLTSKLVHEGADARPTYVTTVTLVFPFDEKGDRR
jgi:signal transduction histidine kinase